MSYLSEFSLSRRFVRQSSTNLQAVRTAQNITQENIASIYHQAIFILAHYFFTRSNFSNLLSSIVLMKRLIFEFNKLFFNNENNAYHFRGT